MAENENKKVEAGKESEEQPKPQNNEENKNNDNDKKEENGYKDDNKKSDNPNEIDYKKLAEEVNNQLYNDVEQLNKKIDQMNELISNLTLKSGAAIHEKIEGEPKLPNGESYKKVEDLDL